MSWYWSPYVSRSERRTQAASFARQMAAEGRPLSPVTIRGRTIARSFWGQSWCRHFERMGDLANRLPRGRTYVRNGSVIDLRVEEGRISGWVSGSEIYRVEVAVSELPEKRWRPLVESCRGKVRSMLDLLEGRLDAALVEVLADPKEGLFPRRREVSLDCSCPDGARLCKHLAALLYGVGARLDEEPELLFRLRGVDREELVTRAGKGAVEGLMARSGAARLGDGEDLGALFGIDLGEAEGDDTPGAGSSAGGRRKTAAGSGRKTGRTTAPPASKVRQRRGAGTGSEPKPKPKPKPKPERSKVASRRKAAARRKPPARKPARAAAGRGPRVEPLPPRLPRMVTPADLLSWGVPRSTFQNWVTSGVLARTGVRGVYRITKETRARIKKTRADRGLD